MNVIGIRLVRLFQRDPFAAVDAQLHRGFLRAGKDIHVHGRLGEIRSREGNGRVDAELMTGGKARGFEVKRGFGAVEGDDGVAVWMIAEVPLMR